MTSGPPQQAFGHILGSRAVAFRAPGGPGARTQQTPSQLLMKVTLAILALGGLAATACRSAEESTSSYELSEARTVSLDIRGMT